MAEFSTIPQAKLADTVVASIRAAIQQNQLAPDEQLSEEALARSFGVSRGPIREAIKRLNLEGLVVMRPNRRALVASLSKSKVNEVFQIRLTLELLAIRQLMSADADMDLSRFEAVLAKMRSIASRDITVHEAVEIDLTFHDCIYELSGYPILNQLWQILRPQTGLFLNSRNRQYPNYAKILFPQHNKIFLAIKARNTKRGVALITAHMKGAHEELMRTFAPTKPET